jgi:DNA-directed RNA polymerase subunit RPC12/RpoP
MSIRLSFSCPACQTRLRASLERVGRSGSCPKCKEKIIVPPQTPEEEAPLLVMDEGHRRVTMWTR